VIRDISRLCWVLDASYYSGWKSWTTVQEIRTTSEGVSVEANALAAAGSSASPRIFDHIIVARLKEWQPRSGKRVCVKCQERMPREIDENKIEEQHERYLGDSLESGK
jgi:hypothetical protein